MAGAGAPAAAGATAAAAAAPAPTAASVYWPAAYQDLAGFTFASGTDTGFWNHGFRDVFAGVVVPPDATGAANAQGCAATNTDAADAAFKQIEDRLTLTPEQRPAFDDLHAAMVRVLARIDAACTPSFANAAPPERMKAISDRLWALRQAMLTLRTPVERAYNAVDDQQRARLDTPGNKVACMGDVAQFPWPRDQIDQVVEPNDQQRAALEMLRQISLQMAQAVASSCPRQALTTPLQRLDAAGDRLNTMLYATMIVGRALGNVYASLSDQQKANFSTIGRALGKNPRAAVVETGAR